MGLERREGQEYFRKIKIKRLDNKEEEKMKTARNIAITDSVILGMPEERILYLLGEYAGVGDYYLKYPDEPIPSWLENSYSHGNFVEYVSLITKDEQKTLIKGRRQRLGSTGWKIYASANDNVYVVDNPYGGRQVMHFYQDGPYGVPMVEGYFADSFPTKVREEIYNEPEKFVGEFYIHCSELEPDWHTMELNLYNEPKRVVR